MTKVPYSDLTSFYTERTDRRAVDLRSAGIPECVVLGHSNYRRAYPPLPQHRHFEVAELAYIEAGRQPYEVAGERLVLAGGEGLIIPPGTPHSSDSQPSFPGRRYWVQFQLPEPHEQTAWMRLPPQEAAPLLEMLRTPSKPYSQWPADFPARFRKLFELHARADSHTRTAMLRTALLSLLFDLLDLQSRDLPGSSQARIRKTTDWIEENLAQEITVRELAALAGLPVTSFNRMFRDITGVTPHNYVLRKRVDQAALRLREGNSSITEVAFECGFSSSQYFATVFKRLVGVTPSTLLKTREVPLPNANDGQ